MSSKKGENESLALEKKENISPVISRQIPPETRYFEVNDLSEDLETSIKKSRIVTLLIIALCMISAACVVIQNRLYDVSFKFGRDGRMTVKRSSEIVPVSIIPRKASYSRRTGTTNQFFTRSKPSKDGQLVQLLEQRISMLENKLSSFESRPQTERQNSIFSFLPFTAINREQPKTKLEKESIIYQKKEKEETRLRKKEERERAELKMKLKKEAIESRRNMSKKEAKTKRRVEGTEVEWSLLGPISVKSSPSKGRGKSLPVTTSTIFSSSKKTPTSKNNPTIAKRKSNMFFSGIRFRQRNQKTKPSLSSAKKSKKKIALQNPQQKNPRKKSYFSAIRFRRQVNRHNFQELKSDYMSSIFGVFNSFASHEQPSTTRKNRSSTIRFRRRRKESKTQERPHDSWYNLFDIFATSWINFFKSILDSIGCFGKPSNLKKRLDTKQGLTGTASLEKKYQSSPVIRIRQRKR